MPNMGRMAMFGADLLEQYMRSGNDGSIIVKRSGYGIGGTDGLFDLLFLVLSGRRRLDQHRLHLDTRSSVACMGSDIRSDPIGRFLD